MLRQRLDRCAQPLRQLLRGRDRRLLTFHVDRATDDDADTREADTAAGDRPVGVDDADRQKRCAGRERELRSAAVPGPARAYGALWEDRQRLAPLHQAQAALESVPVAAAPADREGANVIEPPGERAVAPELLLRHVVQETWHGARQHEGIDRRLVVRRHDERAAGYPLLPVDLYAVDRPYEGPDVAVQEPVEDQNVTRVEGVPGSASLNARVRTSCMSRSERVAKAASQKAR